VREKPLEASFFSLVYFYKNDFEFSVLVIRNSFFIPFVRVPIDVGVSNRP
jgi:hypothetical protein